MGFSNSLKQEIMVRSARHCCVCHKSKGLNIEVHHIVPSEQGGEDTIDNAIALCFDHHADAGHYFAGHPKGMKLSPEELRKHKESWFAIVQEHKIQDPKIASAELTLTNKDFPGFFSPVFVKETTTYFDRNSMRRMFEFIGKDPDSYVEEFKSGLKINDPIWKHQMSKVKTYDDLMDYLNGDMAKQDKEVANNSPQPLTFEYSLHGEVKVINKSNCVLHLKLTNTSKEVFDDYKLYLNLENVIQADSVNKRSSLWDAHAYSYDVYFPNPDRGEFIPANRILVQNDSATLGAICFRPEPSAKVVKLNWELFARNMFASGTMQFEIRSKFEKSIRDRHVEPDAIKPKSTRILPKYGFD
jgi:hypothetical protein